MRHKYSSLIRRAKQKNYKLDLTFEDFKILKLGDCAYCGQTELLLKFYCEVMGINTPWMSIDRMDNNTGYLKTNCVSACFLCNKIKGSFFNYEEMRFIGQNMVKPKMLKFEQEACDTFKEWCEDNVFFDDEIEIWGPSEF